MTAQGKRESAADAFIFDMDGVLCDTIPFHVDAWHAFARSIGKDFADSDILSWMGADNRHYLAHLIGREPTAEEVADCISRKEAMFREAARGRLAPPCGLVEFLSLLESRGARCAVATGGPPDNVSFILGTLGIERFFRTVVDSSMIARCKPAPDCFLEAARRLGASPDECTVFEDAVNGIKAAGAAGMRSVAVTGTNTRETLADAGADAVIDSFKEAADVCFPRHRRA